MQNIGEEIAGCYLRYIKKCDFVTYNSLTESDQGEVDVIGINIKENCVYGCEVAIHTRGLNYMMKGKSNTGERLKTKFRKVAKYLKEVFPEKKHIYMFWSPLIGGGKRMQSVKDAFFELKTKNECDVTLVANLDFYRMVEELRKHAKSQTYEFRESVMRLLQIEENLNSQKTVSDFKKKGA